MPSLLHTLNTCPYYTTTTNSPSLLPRSEFLQPTSPGLSPGAIIGLVCGGLVLSLMLLFFLRECLGTRRGSSRRSGKSTGRRGGASHYHRGWYGR